jgi:hypothetical protein
VLRLGVRPLRPDPARARRQFPALAAAQNYAPVSTDPFDR